MKRSDKQNAAKQIVYPAPLRPDACPPYWELESLQFEKMCAELISRDEAVEIADAYGKQGDTQFGIDILAKTRYTDYWAIQCKCCKDFSPKQVHKASDLFLGHLSGRWSAVNITKFVLVVACDMSSTLRRNALLEQDAKFAAHSIHYEYWDQTTLTRKLRDHRYIVEMYFPYLFRSWGDVVCPQSTTTHHGGPLEDSPNWIGSQLDAMRKVIVEDTTSQLASMKERFRSGTTLECLSEIEQFRGNSTKWDLLDPATKATVVRFQACLQANARNLAIASHLAREAKSLDPEFRDTALQALLAYQTSGAEDALGSLDCDLPDKESIAIKSSLLLERNRLDELEQLLVQYQEIISEEPEIWRIRSLILWSRGYYDESFQAIDTAYALKPDWTNIKLTRGRLLFERALSPAIRSGRLAFHAEVIDWAFINRDDESTQSIREAHSIFDELLRREDLANPDLHAYLECCKLACLGCDFERQAEADAYCSSILERSPDHTLAILWALGRGYAREQIESSIRHLEHLWETHQAKPHHIESLVMCHLAFGRVKDALSLLKKAEGFLKAQDSRQLWLVWQAQCMGLSGKQKQALELIDEIEDGSTRGRLHNFILGIGDTDSASIDRAISNHLNNFQSTGSGRSLFAACKLMAKRGRWAELRGLRDELMEKIGSQEAVRLCAMSEFNNKNYRECIDFIDAQQHRFPQNRLTTELIEMRARCELILGNLGAAHMWAETLYNQHPSPDATRLYAETLYRRGDFPRLSELARKEFKRCDANPINLLYLSKILASEAPDVAQALQRKLNELELSDDMIAATLMQNHRLGIEKDFPECQAQLAELATFPDSGVTAFKLEEAIEWTQSDRKRQYEAYLEFVRAKIPYHLLELAGNANAVELFQTSWVENANVATDGTPRSIIARHGGMTRLKFGGEKPNWLLFADLSALLLASNLGILDEIISAFGPVLISPRTIPALNEMRDALGPVQPSRISPQREILRLVKSGRLLTLNLPTPEQVDAWPPNAALLSNYQLAALQEMYRRGGHYIATLPLMGRDGQYLSEEVLSELRPTLSNVRAVVEMLHMRGPVSKVVYNQALATLVEHGQEPVFAALNEAASSIFLDIGIAETLAEAGLLGILCTEHRTYISDAEYQGMRTELDVRHPILEESKKDIGALLSKLSVYIDTYEVVTVQFSSVEGVSDHDVTAWACFSDIHADICKSLRSETRRRVLWCDDRFMQTTTINQGPPIFGTYEILRGLHARGAITREAYWAKLQLLRERFVLFIPLEIAELMYHLKQASCSGSRLNETLELATIRKYVAHAISREGLLLPSTGHPGLPGERGEMDVLLNILNVVRGALKLIWRNYDQESAVAQSDWILQALHCSSAGLLHASGTFRDVHSEDTFELNDALGFLLEAIQIGPADKKREARKNYLQWVYDRVVAYRIRSNPDLAVALGESLSDQDDPEAWAQMAQRFSNTNAEKPAIDADTMRLATLRTVAQLIVQLPEDLSEQVAAHLIGFEGVGIFNVVSIQGRQYRADLFHVAAIRAINGEPATCVCHTDGAVDTFSPRTDDDGTRFTIETDAGVLAVSDEIFEILAESEDSRRRLLQEHPDWLGVPSSELGEKIDFICAIESPQVRFDVLESARNASAGGYYSQLYRAFTESNAIRWELLSPSQPESLLIHLLGRRPSVSNGTFVREWDFAISAQIERRGFLGAFALAASLPTPLPASLVASFDALEAADQDEILSSLLESPLSPLCRFHALHLATSQASSRCDEEVRSSIDWILSTQGQEEIGAFLNAVALASRSLGLRPGILDWSVEDLLAVVWYHGGELYRIMTEVGVAQECMGELRAEFPVVCTEELLKPGAYRVDIANPAHLNASRFMLPSLSYAVGQRFKLSDSQKDALQRLSYVEVDGKLTNWVQNSLVMDPSCFDNALKAFLAEDRNTSLGNLLDSNPDGESLSSQVREFVSNAVNDLLVDPDSATAWLRLYLGLGHGSIYPELREKLDEILARVDLRTILERQDGYTESVLGAVMARFANTQSENALEGLKRKLLDLGENWTAVCDQLKGDPDLAQWVSSAYLQLLFTVPNFRTSITDRASYAADLLMEISTDSQELSAKLSGLTRRLSEELPAAYAKYFWKTRIHLRTK